LVGCGKIKQDDPQAARTARVEAKRQQAACGSAKASNKLKDLLFDQATRAPGGDKDALDNLADYSFVRMESPLVKGWDPALDVTRCTGRFILEVPHGARRAFAGQRNLQADIDYTAQAAADGTGLVYTLHGAEPIVAQLATFTMQGRAYQPPPAIEEPESASPMDEAFETTQADTSSMTPNPAPTPPQSAAISNDMKPSRRTVQDPERGAERVSAPRQPQYPPTVEGEEATVRAFYAALGRGDGAAASARIIPEKQNSRAFSPTAITRFYGNLAQPLRLTDVASTAAGSYRVQYRYSAGRSHCNGAAIVRVVEQEGQNYIRSIDALSGC
jgi:hypothetical protein